MYYRLACIPTGSYIVINDHATICTITIPYIGIPYFGVCDKNLLGYHYCCKILRAITHWSYPSRRHRYYKADLPWALSNFERNQIILKWFERHSHKKKWFASSHFLRSIDGQKEQSSDRNWKLVIVFFHLFHLEGFNWIEDWKWKLTKDNVWKWNSKRRKQ